MIVGIDVCHDASHIARSVSYSQEPLKYSTVGFVSTYDADFTRVHGQAIKQKLNVMKWYKW